MTKSEFINAFYNKYYSSMKRNTIQKYYPSINEEETEDFIQDAIIKFFNSAREIEGKNEEHNYLSYLYMTVNSQVINHFRKRKLNTVKIIDKTTSIPDDSINFKLDRNIKAILKEILSKRQYQCFILYWLFKMKYHEIGLQLELSIGTVKSNLYYARTSIDKNIDLLEEYKISEKMFC